jgi:hypothetical protein
MPDDAIEIDSIPQRHGNGDEGQPGRAMAPVPEGTVAQFTESVEKDDADERMLIQFLSLNPVLHRLDFLKRQLHIRRERRHEI